MGYRKILHFDLDAFFCAVEEIHHPELKGKAFAVGGLPSERGVVASCSYAARLAGIHSAMPMSQAVRKLPSLVIVSSHHDLYRAASESVMAVLGEITPLVEQISIDEAFLDVSDLPQTSLELAQNLQRRILDETGLPCSLGGASNKLVAKMATDFAKATRRTGTYPNAIHIVPPGEEAHFLAPLATGLLWGIGPKTAATLAGYGIHTIGELAALPERTLKTWFGKAGLDIAQHAQGIDDRPVVVEHEVKSISQEVTFERDIQARQVLLDTLRSLSEQVAYRLRQEGLAGTTIRLKLRWPDFSTHTRQITLAQPVNQDDVIYRVIVELFMTLWQPGKAVRLLGVGVSGLGEYTHQLTLWDTESEKETRLLEALDQLRQRYGDHVIQRGRDFQKNRPARQKSGPSK